MAFVIIGIFKQHCYIVNCAAWRLPPNFCSVRNSIFFLRIYVTGHECPLPGIIKCLVEKCLLCLSTNVSNLRATDFCSHTEYMPFVALHTVTCITKHASCDLGIICAGRRSLDIHILVIHWARQSTLFKNLDCLFFSVSFSITWN